MSKPLSKLTKAELLEKHQELIADYDNQNERITYLEECAEVAESQMSLVHSVWGLIAGCCGVFGTGIGFLIG